MTTLPNGVIDGLTWYELPEDQKGSRIVVVTLGEKAPGMREIREIMASPLWEYGLHARPLPWFRPFDLEAAFPGRRVLFREDRFDAQTTTAWMNGHLDVPSELDLSLEPGRGGSLRLVARTMRNGMTTLVRRKMDTSIPIQDALAVHLPGLLRTSRRPDVAPGRRCRSHLNKVLARATDHAAAMITRWLEDHDPKTLQSTRPPDRLRLPGGLVRAAGVEEIKLTMDIPSSTIMATIALEGGHSLQDDEKGMEISLSKDLPDSIRVALVGRSLRDVIDADWAEAVTIRTVREGAHGGSGMRAHCDGAAFQIPDGGRLTRDEALRIIEGVRTVAKFGSRQVRTITAGALPAFEGMDVQDLATALALLPMPSVLDMGRLGRKGWILRNRGGDIVAEESPGIPFGEATKAILEGHADHPRIPNTQP